MKPGYQEHDRKLINHVYLVDGAITRIELTRGIELIP